MNEEMMTMEECVEAAAQAWCEPETEHLVMEGKLAYAFARILYRKVNGFDPK